MVLTVVLILGILALAIAVWAAVRPAAGILWVAVVLLAIIELLRSLPLK